MRALAQRVATSSKRFYIEFEKLASAAGSALRS